VIEMKLAKQIVAAITAGAILFIAVAAVLPGQAVANMNHLRGCLGGAALAARELCVFGPHWCVGGLVGGCIVGVIVVALGDED